MTDPIPAELALDPPPFELEDVDRALDAMEARETILVQMAEALAGEEDPPAEQGTPEVTLSPEVEVVTRWHVEDDYNAEWAMRMLAALLLERQGLEEQYDLWLQRVKDARDAALRPLERRAAFFDGELRTYAMRVRLHDSKRATITLPSGKLSTNEAKKPTVDVDNEEEFISWAAGTLTEEEYEKVVKTVESPRIMEIRKRVRVDSTEVPESKWVEGDVEHSVPAHTEYSVVWASTGEVVSGLSAAFAETTATAKPAL